MNQNYKEFLEKIEQAGKRVHLLLYSDDGKDQQYVEWRSDLEVAILDWINAHIEAEKEKSMTQNPKQQDEWEKDFYDFYMEQGKYANRRQGYQAHLDYWKAKKSQWEKEERERIIKSIGDLIVEEILICRKENTPTSRLTSLFMKIKKLTTEEK